MRHLLGLSLAALALAACGVISLRHPGPATAPPTAAPPTAAPPTAALPPAALPPAAPPTVVTPAERAYASGAAELEAGNHERALELFAEAWKEYPGHAGVAKDFPVALERLKLKGDEAARRGRDEDAGRAWAATLRYLSHPATKGKVLPFTRAEVRGNVEKLSDNLLEKGLVAYRDGRIEAAISHWQTILAYDPSNTEAAKSVRTATTQLENLKKITPPNSAPAK